MRVMTHKLAALYDNKILIELSYLHAESKEEKQYLQEFLEEEQKESLRARKGLVKKALCDFPDETTESIANFFQVSPQTVRGLCRGTRRNKTCTDYELR